MPSTKTKSIIASVNVNGISSAPVEGSISNTEVSNADETQDTSLNKNGLFSFIWIALLAGFAALLTLCFSNDPSHCFLLF